MPKLNRPPKLCRDKLQAVVYVGGQKVYLGPWGSPEAKKNYSKFVAEWKVNQVVAAVGSRSHTVVADVCLAYLDWAEKSIDPRDFKHCRTAAEFLLADYADTPVDEFGPKSLAAVQHAMEHSGRFSRGYVNKLVNRARTMFRWAASQEMVAPSTADALKYVPALRKGKTIAREVDPREAVADSVVTATLPHLSPTVAGMVKVQRLAAMRPNEVCRMTVGDLDTSGEIWFYRPGMHKGAWRGHDKIVALGKPEQAIINERIAEKSPEQAVFSPKDAFEEKRAQCAANRKWPKNTWKKKNGKPRVYKEEYSPRVYANAITKANREIGEDRKIPHWTPYQLRHAAATEITEASGLDVARAVLGQRTINVMQRYNHADQKIAEKHAAGRGEKAD